MVINFKSNYWRVKPRARIVDGQWHVIIPYFVWCNTGSLSTDYSCTTCNYGEKRSSIRYTINHHSQRLLVELTVVRSGAVTIWSSKGVIHYNRDNLKHSVYNALRSTRCFHLTIWNEFTLNINLPRGVNKKTKNEAKSLILY